MRPQDVVTFLVQQKLSVFRQRDKCFNCFANSSDASDICGIANTE